MFGAMMPYAFAAWTMKSVGKAANDMVKECLKQFPKIMNESVTPDYAGRIRISTHASLVRRTIEEVYVKSDAQTIALRGPSSLVTA